MSRAVVDARRERGGATRRGDLLGPGTRREIAERLQLTDAPCFVSSFDRPNIRYAIVDKQEPRAQLLRFIREEHPGEAGIVYCLSRRKVDETSSWLADQGVKALGYHAGMESTTRAKHQARFQNEDGMTDTRNIPHHALTFPFDKGNDWTQAHHDRLEAIMRNYVRNCGTFIPTQDK